MGKRALKFNSCPGNQNSKKMKNLNSNFNSTSCCASVSTGAAASWVVTDLWVVKNPKTDGDLPFGGLKILERKTNEVLGYLWVRTRHTSRRVHQGTNLWETAYALLKEPYRFVGRDSRIVKLYNQKPDGIYLQSPKTCGAVSEHLLIDGKCRIVDFYLEECSLFWLYRACPQVFLNRWGGEVPTFDIFNVGGKVLFCKSKEYIYLYDEDEDYPNHPYLVYMGDKLKGRVEDTSIIPPEKEDTDEEAPAVEEVKPKRIRVKK